MSLSLSTGYPYKLCSRTCAFHLSVVWFYCRACPLVFLIMVVVIVLFLFSSSSPPSSAVADLLLILYKIYKFTSKIRIEVRRRKVAGMSWLQHRNSQVICQLHKKWLIHSRLMLLPVALLTPMVPPGEESSGTSSQQQPILNLNNNHHHQILMVVSLD